MTFLPIFSLVMCGIGVALVLIGRRDPLRRQIADRIGTLGALEASEGRDRWFLAKALSQWDGVLFGSIKQESHIVAGTIRSGHVAAFVVVLVIGDSAALWFGGPIWLGVATVVILFLGRSAVKYVVEHHQKEFLEHFPAYLDRVRKLVEVGNSLSTAMTKGLAFANPRVASYIAPALRRHDVGMNLATALDMQAKHLGLPEISQLALVAYVITRYGGSLKDSVAHIAQVERDRVQANRELDALTAEVRASAKVFAALPLVVAGVIFSFQPAYITFFFNDPMGPTIMAGCGASLFLGLAAMRRLSKIE